MNLVTTVVLNACENGSKLGSKARNGVGSSERGYDFLSDPKLIYLFFKNLFLAKSIL